MGLHCLLMMRLLCQKKPQQRQAITCSSIYKYYYYYYSSLSSSSSNPPIFRSSSSIIIPNFQFHTLSRIANPNPTLNRGDIFKRSWADDDWVSREGAAAHNCFHITDVFSNSSTGDRIPTIDDDQIDTINSEIYLCCRINQVNYGFSLLAGIIKLGLVPNRYTYCTLLIGLMFQSRFMEAIYMFDVLIIHREIQPDILTYETILQVCFDMGCELDTNIFSMFLNYAKSEIGYQPLDIKYCMRHHPWCQGPGLHHAIMSHYLPKHMMVNEYCRDKSFHLALDVLRNLERDLSVVGIEVYNTVISHMVYAGEIDQAVDLFYRSVAELKLKPTAKTYAAIILGLSYKGLWDKALELLTDIYFSDYLPHDFKLACDNFFQERLPPHMDVPCLTVEII